MPGPEAKSGPPSIYSNMAKMAMSPKPPTAGPDGAAGGAGPGGGMEEKKQIVTTLTSVLKKWEELEKDPKGKEIIQTLVDGVKKYQMEVLKEGTPGGGPGAGGAAEPPPDTSGGGAASGAGGGGGDKGEKVPA